MPGHSLGGPLHAGGDTSERRAVSLPGRDSGRVAEEAHLPRCSAGLPARQVYATSATAISAPSARCNGRCGKHQGCRGPRSESSGLSQESWRARAGEFWSTGRAPGSLRAAARLVPTQMAVTRSEATATPTTIRSSDDDPAAASGRSVIMRRDYPTIPSRTRTRDDQSHGLPRPRPRLRPWLSRWDRAQRGFQFPGCSCTKRRRVHAPPRAVPDWSR